MSAAGFCFFKVNANSNHGSPASGKRNNCACRHVLEHIALCVPVFM